MSYKEELGKIEENEVELDVPPSETVALTAEQQESTSRRDGNN